MKTEELREKAKEHAKPKVIVGMGTKGTKTDWCRDMLDDIEHSPENWDEMINDQEHNPEWEELHDAGIFDGSEAMSGIMRTFETGATRDVDQGKLDYEGFLSPIALESYAHYMHRNRTQTDGNIRDGDNWQKGMPLESYMKSGWRHFMDWFMEHRGYGSREGLEEALCGVIFNAFGYLHTILQEELDE